MKIFNKKGIKTMAACAVLAAALGVSANTAAGVDIVGTSDDITQITPGASTFSALKQWYFKEANGKLYKRLYNHQTGKWETDWIYVCPL